ncbi:hypothetical protein Phum_PHUM576790 [Pediculus humanus corporis]|uniref:Uncharacterized protein n=1 Tax=Pediculus humanus subsp. corporis TaxID=121224 RepID=E0W1G1_PEDHC|nr:uncharacterized protein Phum_PHUM576790 [Pediculus humanus corporis]EEB19467.1 hypothetical protein Phum_PHUM576790 [Pediculus humanus corporis]
MHYRNSSFVPPYLLTIPGCEKWCRYEKFKKILSEFIVEDWEKECEEEGNEKSMGGETTINEKSSSSIKGGINQNLLIQY